MVDMAHFSGLVAGKGYPNPVDYADVVTSTTHKVFRSARGGIILTNNEALSKKFNSAVFPGYQGGPLMHIIAAKAVGFLEALKPEIQNYIKNVYILADGNPAPDVAKFSFTPDMGMCSATTRIRLSKTQNVVLVAENNKNEYFMTKSKVKVTIGGCGG